MVGRDFHVVGRDFNQHLKKALERFSSLLNVDGWLFVCVKLTGVGVSVLERQRAILEDGCHHTVVWQRYCKKGDFSGL